MISIPDLEDLVGLLRFPRELRDSDQFDTDLGESVRREGGIERVEE